MIQLQLFINEGRISIPINHIWRSIIFPPMIQSKNISMQLAITDVDYLYLERKEKYEVRLQTNKLTNQISGFIIDNDCEEISYTDEDMNTSISIELLRFKHRLNEDHRLYMQELYRYLIS